jgi:predicted permease
LGNLEKVDAGFNRRGLILFRIDATSAGYTREQYARLQSRVQEKLERLPGVRAATFSSVALLSSVRQSKTISIPGHALPPEIPPIVNTNGLAPNFFTAMELPLVLGRGFTEGDDGDSARIAVVNQAFVRTYLDGKNPVGRHIAVGRLPADRVEVVGVAADAKYTTLRGVTPATIYLPALQRLDGAANFAVRLAAPAPAALSAAAFAIRAAVREIDPALPVLNLRTQEEQIGRLHAQELLFARLSGFFGLVALVLAGVGLYGLMSHAVLRRTGEIGLRMALGAPPVRVLRLILRESLVLAGLGVTIGAAAAYGSGRLVATMLFDLSPADPLTFGCAASVLVASAVLASFLPAHRASRIDPIVALKIE